MLYSAFVVGTVPIFKLNLNFSSLKSMIILSISIFIYLCIGYMIGITRYRFTHSEEAKTCAWKKMWQANVFYLFTTGQYSSWETGMKWSYNQVFFGDWPLSVFVLKPSTYVALMMVFWVFPTALTLSCWIMVFIAILLWKLVIKPLWIILRFSVRFSVRCFRKIMNIILPADIKDPPETRIVVVE